METTSFSMKENKIKSWVPTKKSDFLYTSDQLIDAYLYGKREALEATKRLAADKLNNNIDKSGTISINLLKLLINEKFTPIDAYLRVNDLDKFEIMVAIPEDEMISDDFLKIYNVVSGLEKQNRDEYYNVFISFCPVNDHFEEINVLSDGFLLKLAKNDR